MRLFIILWIITLLATFSHASLSPKIMDYYFEWNNKQNEWNLQHLIWKVWVSSYLALSKEHQETIKKIADIILDDNQLKNPSSLSEDTEDLGYFVEDTVRLLQDILLVREGVEKSYNLRLWDIDDLWLSVEKCELLKAVFTELYSNIVWVNEVHKFLDEQNLKLEMDFNKVKVKLLEEIMQTEAILKEQDDIIAWKKWILKEQDDIIAWKKWILKEQDDIIAWKKWILKEQREKIAQLNKYIEVMKRFIKVGWGSQ